MSFKHLSGRLWLRNHKTFKIFGVAQPMAVKLAVFNATATI